MIYGVYVFALIQLVCWIIVLVKVFQSGKIGMGICCICSLFAFIYGWIKSGELGIRNIMLVWTGGLIGTIVMNVLVAQAGGMAGMR